jgi:hypothetical protein
VFLVSETWGDGEAGASGDEERHVGKMYFLFITSLFSAYAGGWVRDDDVWSCGCCPVTMREGQWEWKQEMPTWDCRAAGWAKLSSPATAQCLGFLLMSANAANVHKCPYSLKGAPLPSQFELLGHRVCCSGTPATLPAPAALFYQVFCISRVWNIRTLSRRCRNTENLFGDQMIWYEHIICSNIYYIIIADYHAIL